MKIAILLAACAFASWAQTFPVAGTIVDSATGSPIKRAHIVLSGVRPRELSAVTGEDGKFSFEAPPGKYSLYAERHGWRQTFGQAPSATFGSSIIAGPGQDTANLVFRWYAPGAIFGRVLDDRGDAAPSALVQLIRVRLVAGRKRSSTVAWTRADDVGNYRFGPIAAGTYYLAASGDPWYAAALGMSRRISRNVASPGPERSPAQSDPDVPSPAYAPSYFPNAAEARGATPVALNAGGEVQADFTLRTVTGASLYFSCPKDPKCAGTVNLYGDAIDGVETMAKQGYAQSQYFEGVPPGRYTIQFIGGGGSMRKAVDVTAAGATVELAPQKPPTVSGKVDFKGARPRRPIYVRLINQETGGALARAVESDGSFSWAGLPVAKYQPQIGSVDGFFLSQVSVDGAPFQDGIIDLVEGSSVRMNIVATDDTGRFKGFVMSGEKPVVAALVVLAPVKDSPDFAAYRGFQTDSDGSFDFTNVRAGDYYLFALETNQIEYANPSAIRPYFASATTVHIEAHRTYEQNVSLSTLVRQAIP